MTPRPSWFPADYETLLAGLARKAVGFEERLRCWQMILRPETVLSPEDHLTWAVVFGTVIKEVSEPLGMVSYKRNTGDEFYSAMLTALEGIARERADAVELATEVASGDLKLWAAIARLDDPPKPAAPAPPAAAQSAEELLASTDPARLEEMLKAIEQAQRELEAMPSFTPAKAVEDGASAAITAARERLVNARAADVEPALLAACSTWPALRSTRLVLPVPPNAQAARRLSTAAENVEIAFDVEPTPAQLRALYRYWSVRDLWRLDEDAPERMVLERGPQRVELTMAREAERTRLGVRIKSMSPVDYR